MIWRTYAEKEFAGLPAEPFATPSFGGVKWNLLGPLLTPRPKPRPTVQPRPACGPLNNFCKRRGHKSPTQCLPGVLLPGCPTPTPTPTMPTPSPPPSSPFPAFPGGGGTTSARSPTPQARTG